MLEVQFERFGPPRLVAKCLRVAEPGKPSAWEALVKIDAFPINPADLAMLSGAYGFLPKPPCGIGMEAVGTVVQAGDSVTNVSVGDRVVVIANSNWAQFKTVSASLLQRVPNELDPILAVNMKVNAATAYLLLTTFAKLKKGSWVIQNAPLSNVGRTVIQFAKALGFKTLNLVRREEALQEVLEFGGDEALLLHEADDPAEKVKERIGRSKLSLGLDAVAGAATEQLASACSSNAFIITYGMLSNSPCILKPEHILFRGIQHQGFWLSKLLNRFSFQERSDLYDKVAELLLEVEPYQPFSRYFPLDRIDEALAAAETGKGKIVVFPHGVPQDSLLAASLSSPDLSCDETSPADVQGQNV